MKMDEVDLEEDVLVMVSQEETEIVDILCKERNAVLQQIYGLVEAPKREMLRGMPSLRESVMALVDYFKHSDRQRCCDFLNTMWGFCDSLPLDLETKIVSVVGFTSGTTVNHTPLDDIEKSPRSQNAKRARLDQVQNYMNAVKSFLKKKFERVTKDMRKEVPLNETWLCWRSPKSVRTRDRPIKAHERVESSQDHKESVESLLENTGRVIILSGQAGSGKTLLMHCLGQHWAQGSYPSIQLLFLLEFRQLNLVSQPLSLKELLFLFFLPPEGGYEESEEVLSYILDNPEKICFIFDGYDEFGAKLTNPEKLDFIDPNQRLPMVDLLSGLCSYKILPKCTVLVTCRPRDVFDLFGNCLDHCVAELVGFNQQRVKEYTEEYFQEKGSKHKERAVSLLMGSHHLLSMSHVPGLCHVCCICLDHLLSSAESQQNQAQLPTSLTQIYLHILSAFLKRCQGGKTPDDRTPLLQTYRTQIGKLSRLAMGGLEKSCIVFSAQELSPELMNFGANAGILSRVDLTCADGSRSLGCAFTHLTMQEFMAALHLMTNPDITESQLKRKLNLKSRWTARSDPKTVFTDSLHLFLCGLAADACTLDLVRLKVGEDACAVRTRQDAVRKILKKFVFSGRQTGPKIVELCRCAHETQDITLASAVGARERFELRNITLNPVDIEALAFVTSAANQMVCLDFGACSIDTECLNIIPNCKNLEHLIFHSRKYEDKFAEVLSCILPKLHNLKHLEFTSANLTDAGAAKLFQALELCPQITKLNLTDNSLKDESIRKIMDLVPKLPNITSVMLGKNSFTKNRIFMLIQNMNSFPNLEKVHINGKQEITIHLSPNSHTPNGRTDGAEDSGFSKELILKDYNLKLTHVKTLCGTLGVCNLTLLNLSHNSLGNKGLKQLLDHLPSPWTIQEIDVSKNGVDMDGLVYLSASLHAETNLREIQASHNGKVKLLLKFNVSRNSKPFASEKSDFHLEKKFSLAQSNVQPADMKRLCKNLSRCPNHLELDFTDGTFRDETIKSLLNFLPDLTSLMLLNLSHVQMSTDGAVLLVRTLADCQRTTVVDLRPQGKAFIKFVQHKAEAASCRLTQYRLTSSDVEKLCAVLERCSHLTDLDLSSNFLGDDGVRTFTDLLPRIKISSSVSLNDNGLTEEGALNLGNLLNTCERVSTVELSLGEQERSQVHFVQGVVTVRTLRLRQCQFEESHLQKLMEILSSCPRPLRVQLSSVTLPFQSQLSLLSSLARLKSIHVLELSNNSLDDEAISFLVSQMNSDYGQRTIRIEEPWIKADAAVGFVASCLHQNPNVKEIRVEKTCLVLTFENITPSNDPCLFAVRSISFADCEVEGQHLSSLQLTMQKCSSLEELSFSKLAMGTSGADFLSSVLPSLENLKRISLSSKAETGDEAVIFALQHTTKHLESLSLSHHVIGDSAAAALGNALLSWTNLRSLTLTQCSGWTAAGGNGLVHGLVQCLSLEEIRLESVVLDEESTVCLAQGLHSMTLLKKLSLNKMTIHETGGVQCLLAGLRGLTALEDLELVSLRMGDLGIKELVEHIPKWSNLRNINLSENVVSDHAGELLVKALSNCTDLQQLHLSRNNLAHGFAAKLGQVLPGLSQLSELDLSENKLGSVGCSSLYEGLIKMKALKKLHLTSVGTPDLVTVVSSLKDCTSIEDISLSWNECGNDVVLKLAEVLPLCSKLKRLDLEANNINTAGAKTLAACLASCPWIEVIRLWRNPILKDDQILKDQRLNFSST